MTVLWFDLGQALSMIGNGPDYGMRHLPDPNGAWLRRWLREIDASYAVPVAIAVAAFILALLHYFAGLS